MAAAFVMVVLTAAPSGAFAEGEFSGGADEDLLELLRPLFGLDQDLNRVADATPDADGDATNIQGTPQDTPHNLTEADQLEVKGPIDTAALDSACDSGQIGDYRAVCAVNRQLFEASRDFLLLYALTGQTEDLINFQQVTYAWANQLRPVYQGQPGDTNTGRNESFDLFLGPDGYQVGFTRFVDPSFEFTADFEGAVAFFGNNLTLFLVPLEQFVSQCVNRAITMVWEGGVLDTVLLGNETSGTISNAPPPPQDEPPPADEPPPPVEPPTEAEDAPPAVVSPPPANDPPAVEEPAVDPTPDDIQTPASRVVIDDGGSGLGPFIVIGVVVFIGAGLTVIYLRKNKKDCREEEIAYAVAREQLAQAEQRRAAAEAAYVQAVDRLTRAHSAGDVAPVPPSRTEFSNDADFAQAQEDFRAVNAAFADAQTELAAAMTGEEQARAKRDAALDNESLAIDAENTARIALDECLGRASTRTRTGGGAPGGGAPGGGGTGGQPGPSGQAPAQAATPCEPDGKRRLVADNTLPFAVVTVPDSLLTITFQPYTTRWRQFADGGGLEAENFAATSDDDIAAIVEGISPPRDRGGRGAVTARIQVRELTVSCVWVEVCTDGSWKRTGEKDTKVTEGSTSSRNLGRAFWTDPQTLIDFLVNLKSELQPLNDARVLVNSWEC